MPALNATRRIVRDLQELQANPLVGCVARPCSDAELSLWTGAIEVPLRFEDRGVPGAAGEAVEERVPLYFLIEFPANYPHAPPAIVRAAGKGAPHRRWRTGKGLKPKHQSKR